MDARDVLTRIVQKDAAPLRRASATALGQIADPAAVPALLASASRDDNDDFVMHVRPTLPLVVSVPLPDFLSKDRETGFGDRRLNRSSEPLEWDYTGGVGRGPYPHPFERQRGLRDDY